MHKSMAVKITRNIRTWKNILTVEDVIHSKNQIDTVNLKITKYLGNLNNTQ